MTTGPVPDWGSVPTSEYELEVAAKMLAETPEAPPIAGPAATPATPEEQEELRKALLGPGSVRREGLSFVGMYPDAELVLSRLHDGRDGLRGELAVRWTAAPAGDGHLHRATFSLSSMTARSSLAKYLRTRAPACRVDWGEVLERFCLAALDLHRDGPGWEIIGDRPTMPVPPRLVDGSFAMPLLQPTLLYGPQGARKSTIAQGLVVGTATGVSPLPGVTCREGPVAVCDWETNGQELNDRTTAVAKGAGVEPPMYFYRRMTRPLADQVEEIARLRAQEGIELLVVDSVQKATGANRDGATYEEAAQRLFEALDVIGVTSLLIDHVAGDDLRTGEGRAISKPYGSVLKMAWARAAYELKPEADAPEGSAEILLRNEKMSAGPTLPPYGLRVLYGVETIRFARSDIEADGLVRSLSVAERMRRALAAGAMSDARLSEEIDAKQASIRNELRRRPALFLRLEDGRIGLRRDA